MIAWKDFPSLAVPGHYSGGCNLEGASWRREERVQKRTTPTPTREGPASGWPLALALPQKSPKPRLSLFPHRAVQIFIRHTHLLADSVTPSLPAMSSLYLLLLSFLVFHQIVGRFRCEKLDNVWPHHRQHARAAGILPTIMNRDQTRAQVGCTAPLHCHLHMLTPQ